MIFKFWKIVMKHNWSNEEKNEKLLKEREVDD